MAFVDDPGHPWYKKLFLTGLRSKHVRMIEFASSSPYKIKDEDVFWVNKDGGGRRLRDAEYHNGSIWVLPNYNTGPVILTPKKLKQN